MPDPVSAGAACSESPPAAVLGRDALRRLAGPTWFERGERYAADAAVSALVEDGGVVARVRGTSNYRVRMWVDGSALGFACSCPLGREGGCCKHCVAVGLLWLAGGEQAVGGESQESVVTMDRDQAHLAGQSKEALVELPVALAMGDERLHRRLLEDGHADAVVELVEHAVDLVESSTGYVDDFGGDVGGTAGGAAVPCLVSAAL